MPDDVMLSDLLPYIVCCSAPFIFTGLLMAWPWHRSTAGDKLRRGWLVVCTLVVFWLSAAFFGKIVLPSWQNERAARAAAAEQARNQATVNSVLRALGN